MSNPVWGEDFTKSYVQCTVNCLSSDTSHISGGLKGREKDWKMSSTIDMTEEEFYKEVYDYGTL